MRIEYVPIEPGEARDPSRIDDILTELEAASALVEADNFAEEGLDDRAIVSHLVAEEDADPIEETNRNAASLAAGGAFAQFTHNGTAFRIVPSALSLGTDEALRIRFRTWLQTTESSGYGLTGAARFRLVYFTGALTVAVPYAQVRTTKRTFANPTHYHAPITLVGWLFGQLPAVNWIEVQFTLAAAAVAFPSRSRLSLTRYRYGSL